MMKRSDRGSPRDPVKDRCSGAGAVELDPDCRAYLEARRLRVPRRQVEALLGWSPRKLETIRKRVQRYVARNPLRTEYVFGVTQGGRQIISLWFQPLTSNCPKDGDSALRIQDMEDLHALLRDSKLTLSRVEVQFQTAQEAAEALEAKLAKIRSEAQLDAEDSILQQRPSSTGLTKLVVATESELTGARKIAVAHAGAVQRQRAAVEALQDQIVARRKQDFEHQIAEPKRALREAIEALIATSDRVRNVLRQYPSVSDGHTLFPSSVVDDPEARSVERAMMRNLFETALRIVDEGRNYTSSAVA
jgi:hypothetical protein